MTQAEAARRLGKNRATIKRYLEQYPELVSADKTVDFAELQRHRADNPLIADAALVKTVAKQTKPAKPEAGSRRESKHRLEEIKSWDAEADWAVKIGQLVDPNEFLDAVNELGTALRDKLVLPDPMMCERLAEERDPRTIASILREMSRRQLAETVAALLKIATEAAPKTEIACAS